MRTQDTAIDIDLTNSRNGHNHNLKPVIDRLPPHSQETEQGILGCVFLDPANALPACIEKIGANTEAFYDLRHKTIYETFIELFEDGAPIDTISVLERLNLWDKLQQCGGIAYLSELPEATPSAANIDYYLQILMEKFALRRMIHACTDVVSRIYDHQGDADDLLDQCERDILQLSESRVEPANLTMGSLVHQVINDIEAQQQNQGQPTGLGTGFIDYDHMTGGLHDGEMVVIAARPSMGKTSLAMNIVEHVACTLHLPVGLCSLEMTGKALVNRMLCSRARVNLRNAREGFLAERDFPKLSAAAGVLHHAPIYIDDAGGQSILQIRAKIRRWWQQHEIKLGVIDYLQLANALGGKRRFESRQQEVSEISSGIKNLAKELNIPIIALSQMNREFEREKNRKPRLADLRESGSIEQDADVIGFLYRPQTDTEDQDDNYEAAPINLLIAKSRNGPTGDIHLTFLKSYTRFESAARVSDDDVPQDQPQTSLPYVE